MKKTSILIFFFLSFLLESCKYDLSPAGTYKGSFNAFGGVPVPSATDGTLKIQTQGNGMYSITLSYSGNPDITVSDVNIVRTNSIYGAYFNGYDYSPPHRVLYLDMYEMDGSMSVDYQCDTVPYTFSFQGIK